jgi:phosphoribosylformylglycinamidine cyclo-ligase
VQAGCALIGGETAEHPGVMRADEYDLSGTGIGVLNAGSVLGADQVKPGDALIALEASGLHSNGYSLVRHVLARTSLALDATPARLGGRTLADELLEPTRIYARDCLALASECGAHAFAHVTGGGLAANLRRVLPATLDAIVDRSTWAPLPIFDLIADLGGVPAPEMERTFNLGVGMVAVVPPEQAADALSLAETRGLCAWRVGYTELGTGSVRMIGNHAARR